MDVSLDTPEIHVEIIKVILKVQKGLSPLTKTADNTTYDSKFTPLPEVMTKALELLNKNGVAVLQSPTITSDGASAFKTTLAHRSGATYTEITKLALDKVTPQAHASAITYMRRYQLMSMLGLTSEDDDDDGNKASGVSGKASQEQREQLDSLMVHLRMTPEMRAKEQRNIRTTDHAAQAIVNYEKMISMRRREHEAEDAAIQTEGTTRINVEDADEAPSIVERIEKLDLIENKIVFAVTNKPFLSKCDEGELEMLANTLTRIESGEKKLPDTWYRAGHPPTKTPAEGTDKQKEEQPS